VSCHDDVNRRTRVARRRTGGAVLALVLAACGGKQVPAPDATAETHALGMNDVSVLLPLPASLDAPVLTTLDGVVDRAVFHQAVLERNDLAPKMGAPPTFEDFQVVSLRWDLCSRDSAGACPPHDDGRLRLIAQQLAIVNGAVSAQDIAVHMFFPIPEAELPGVITELRALARIANSSPAAPLAVATPSAEYLARLHALVMRYARPDNLVKLTVIGQEAESNAFAWRFRGFDRGPYGFTQSPIPTIPAAEQSTLVAGGDVVYNSNPVADRPHGFAMAINGATFDAATPADQRTALEALVSVQNPLVHGAADTQCMACHVSANLTVRRAQLLGVDPATVTGAFTSTRPITADSVASHDPRIVRVFGWVAVQPAIAPAVANATAEVLDEIDARYPAW
jgi:hypothetical protein